MNTKYPLLNIMIDDMKKQDVLYQPASFWKYSSKFLIGELEENDIKDF